MTDWIELNRANWDDRAPIHAASEEYGLDRFVDDPRHLSDVVRFDLPRLGDLTGLVGVHLQCHIGTDTLSLSRLGARMTGLDFSGPSRDGARGLAERAGADIRYVQATVDDALAVLEPASFDLVFTGIGALCWLPDIRRWASVVAGLLRPGGRLLNHGIARLRVGDPEAGPFSERYVFPDAAPLHLSRIQHALERAGFVTHHVEDFAQDYARTLTEWVTRLEANLDEAIRLAGAERVRVWRLYLRAARNGFESGFTSIYQVRCSRA